MDILPKSVFAFPILPWPPTHNYTFGMYWYMSSEPNIYNYDPMPYLDLLAANGVNEIYPGTGNLALDENIRTFIAAATERGIAVFRERGYHTWILPANRPGFHSNHMNRFITYQAGAAENEQFAGILFNIEPHQFRANNNPLGLNRMLTPNRTPERDAERHRLLQYYVDFQVEITSAYPGLSLIGLHSLGGEERAITTINM